MKPIVQEDCAMLIGGINGPIFAGKQLGVSDIGCFLMAKNEADKSAWMGFSIHFPIGQDNENNGFGMCYTWSESQGRALPAKTYAITVKFPRTHVVRFIRPADNGIKSRFPDEKRQLSLVEVFLGDKARVVVEGYGMPYANKGHVAEKWLQGNTPIVNGVTLIELLEQKSFHFVVALKHDELRKDWDFNLLPPPFSYPYGTDYTWKEPSVYNKLLTENRGHQFAPRRSFDNTNELLTVLSQSQVQDIMWVEEAAEKIRTMGLSAYFVPVKSGLTEEDSYFAIVALPREFRTTFKSAWRRLSKDGRLKIRVHAEAKTNVSSKHSLGHLDALILDKSTIRDDLKAHMTEAHELVLHVRMPSRHGRARGANFNFRTFRDRHTANAALRMDKEQWNCIFLDFNTNLKDFERKVDQGVCVLQSSAEPCNVAALGLTKAQREIHLEALQEIRNRAQFRMRVHMDLLLGTGFYNSLRVKQAAEGKLTAALADLGLDDVPRPLPRSLPTLKLLDMRDHDFVDALMQEALPEDRSRFTQYLLNRPLGLSIIIAPPGFGKTTALAVGALAMANSQGKLYLSGPTHVSVDNAAARLDAVCARVMKRLNDRSSQQHDSPKYRRKLIIRAYRMDDELTALKNLLRNPRQGDNALPKSKWRPDPKWKLHLSLAYWTLVMLRAPMVRQLGRDDKPILHAIRARYDGNEIFATLRAVATGAIDWQQYARGNRATDDDIKGIMTAIIDAADVMATTPALACKEPFCAWKHEQAQAFVIDEAANMHWPDLLCVWGNTCQPCLLAGDEKQLPPTVMTKHERDAEGNALNRFAGDGALSPIHHFKAMGWPIYRLRVQLRMAAGQFDLTHNEVYKDVPFTYGPGCNIALPQHEMGRKLDMYLRHRFPSLKPAPAGKLSPVFVHCQGSKSFRDKFSGSIRSPDQVIVALRLLADFVKSSGVGPEDIVVISPYSANINTIEQLRKRPEFAVLRPMRPAATVDSFQGQEGGIVVIIMGTTVSSGPGFTCDEQRLNVLLSRHKSGLVIVGDVNVTGDVLKKETPLEGMVVIGKTGEEHFEKCSMLRNIHFALQAAGRVARAQVVKK